MKNRGTEVEMRLVLTSNLKKRLAQVARELRLSLPETVLLAIATQLPNVERPEAHRPQGKQDRDDGLMPKRVGECRPSRRPGGATAEEQGTVTRQGGRGENRKDHDGVRSDQPRRPACGRAER